MWGVPSLTPSLTLPLGFAGGEGRYQHIPGEPLDGGPVLGIGEAELGDSLQLVLGLSHELERPFQLQGEGERRAGNRNRGIGV